MNKQRKDGHSYQAVSASDLGITISRSTVSPVAFATWVRALLQNWRQGTVACKGRSDVNRTNKKPWKQKGTGRARAGSARSPLWRGGGVIFGPMMRTRKLKENRDIHRSVMASLLHERIENKNLFCLDWTVQGDLPKVSQAYKTLKDAGLHQRKALLFVAPDDILTYASFANMPSVTPVLFDQPNAFDAARGRCWIYLKKDENLFKEMVTRWI
jgi:large subunit ribosomal protein L4